MIIRQETSADYEEVYQVVKFAFEQAEHSDGHEQDLVVMLRNSAAYIPELSLVASEDDRIIGHILFSKANVRGYPVLALAPLSVLPLYQRRGVGLALIEEGHRIAKEMGYLFSVVLGHPAYYRKAGYIPANRFGIKPPFTVNSENFMAACLSPKVPLLNGVMEYDKAFGIKKEHN